MVKTRSSQYELLYYDSEIERTLRRIRKEQRKIQVDLEFNLEKLFEEESNMAERTLKELGAPKLDDEPLCIDLVKQLTNQIGQVQNQSVQYQQKTDTHLQNIDHQIGTICTSLSNLETQLAGKLPSQPIPNPNENVKAVTLRSGKELVSPKVKSREVEKEIEVFSNDKISDEN
ncbi:Argininosuccinate lyase, partial [Bienertia sinuspersici]